MNYPIILRSDKEPRFDLIQKIAGRIPNSSDCELEFAEFLKEKDPVFFRDNLRIGKYFPDVTYLSKKNNLIICIEVDEPYSLSGKLTHYEESPTDIIRNNYFYLNGFHVIRFSEKQIRIDKTICYQTIKYFIKSLSEQKYIITLNSLRQKIEDPIWTKSQAIFKKNLNERNYYPFEIIESELSYILKKQDTVLEAFINKELDNFQNCPSVIIPYKIIRLKHPKSAKKAFSIQGKQFSLSPYKNYCIDPVKLITEENESEIFNAINNLMAKKIVFNESDLEFFSFLILEPEVNSKTISVMEI